MGRNRIDKSRARAKSFSFTLPEHLRAMMIKAALSHDVTPSEIVRHSLEFFLAQKRETQTILLQMGLTNNGEKK